MYWNGLWEVPGLKDLKKESKREGQKKAETNGKRRPMAGAAMLAHLRNLRGMWGPEGGGPGNGTGGSAKIRPPREPPSPHIQRGLGSGREQRAGGVVACRVRGTVVLPVPVAVSSARPPRKRRRDTDTQAVHRNSSIRRKLDRATVHIAQDLHTALSKHNGTDQPLKYTDSTTGQATVKSRT